MQRASTTFLAPRSACRSHGSPQRKLRSRAIERYAEINARLAEIHTDFSNNVLADEEGYVTYFDQSTKLSAL